MPAYFGEISEFFIKAIGAVDAAQCLETYLDSSFNNSLGISLFLFLLGVPVAMLLDSSSLPSVVVCIHPLNRLPVLLLNLP